MTRGLKPGRVLKPCGTWAAYMRHWRNFEEPCDACLDAAREHGRKRTDSRTKEPGVGRGNNAAYKTQRRKNSDIAKKKATASTKTTAPAKSQTASSSGFTRESADDAG